MSVCVYMCVPQIWSTEQARIAQPECVINLGAPIWRAKFTVRTDSRSRRTSHIWMQQLESKPQFSKLVCTSCALWPLSWWHHGHFWYFCITYDLTRNECFIILIPEYKSKERKSTLSNEWSGYVKQHRLASETLIFGSPKASKLDENAETDNIILLCCTYTWACWVLEAQSLFPITSQ